MGDTQKKKSETEMEKVEKKEESRSASFTGLRDDLFCEASKLVSEDPATRIAIFVISPPSESDVSIQSFGYPSVEGVVQTFLADNNPVSVPEDGEEDDDEDDDDDDEDPSPQLFWWEDKKLYDSMNAEQLKAACDELSRLKNYIHSVAKQGAQGSGSREDLHNDKAGPKP